MPRAFLVRSKALAACELDIPPGSLPMTPPTSVPMTPEMEHEVSTMRTRVTLGEQHQATDSVCLPLDLSTSHATSNAQKDEKIVPMGSSYEAWLREDDGTRASTDVARPIRSGVRKEMDYSHRMTPSKLCSSETKTQSQSVSLPSDRTGTNFRGAPCTPMYCQPSIRIHRDYSTRMPQRLSIPVWEGDSEEKDCFSRKDSVLQCPVVRYPSLSSNGRDSWRGSTSYSSVLPTNNSTNRDGRAEYSTMLQSTRFQRSDMAIPLSSKKYGRDLAVFGDNSKKWVTALHHGRGPTSDKATPPQSSSGEDVHHISINGGHSRLSRKDARRSTLTNLLSEDEPLSKCLKTTSGHLNGRTTVFVPGRIKDDGSISGSGRDTSVLCRSSTASIHSLPPSLLTTENLSRSTPPLYLPRRMLLTSYHQPDGSCLTQNTAGRQPVIEVPVLVKDASPSHDPPSNSKQVDSTTDNRSSILPSPHRDPSKRSFTQDIEVALCNMNNNQYHHPVTPTSIRLPVMRPVELTLNEGNKSFSADSGIVPPGASASNVSPSKHKYDSDTSAQSGASKSNSARDRSSELRCTVCCTDFLTQRAFTNHLALEHNIDKPHICGYCGKGFMDKFDLKRHVRTHTGVRPYQCDVCPRAFTQRCSLETHISNVHGLKLRFAFKERRKKLHVCEDCGNSATDAHDHYLHMWVKHKRLDMPKRVMQKFMRRMRRQANTHMRGRLGEQVLSNENLICQTICTLGK